MNSTKFSAQALLLAAASTMPFAAHAQSQPDQEEAAEDEQVIVVTGSRIAIDSPIESVSPITVVDAEAIQTNGEADLATLLRDIPALQGSLPGIDSVNQVANGDSSDLGLSLLNLRNLGTVRTLVLEDGRRHVAGTGGSAAVDINAIPAARVKNVEVLTGGASSIYGADAVTGVVNFSLRTGRDFDGIEYNLQGGISDEGDAENFRVSVATGGEFADGRGSAVFSAQYTRQTSLVAGDRSFAGSGVSTFNTANQAILDLLGITADQLGLPAGEIPRNAYIPDNTLPISSALGIIAIDDAANFPSAFGAVVSLPGDGTVPTIPGTNIPVAQVFDNGTLRAFNEGVFVDGFSASGGDGITQDSDQEIILPEIDQFVVSAGADFELTPNIEVFFEGKFAFTDGFDQAGIPFNDDIPIQLDNPFIPAQLGAQVTELQGLGFDPAIAVSRDVLDVDVFPIEETERTTFRFVTGLRGELPSLGWNWEVSYNYGRTEVESVLRNTRLDDRYYFAIDAVALTDANLPDFIANGNSVSAVRNGTSLVIDPGTAQAGDIICRSELDGTNPGVSPFPSPPTNDDGTGQAISFTPGTGQCAPISIFGANAITGAGADFVFVDINNSTIITQEQFLATIAGDTAEFLNLPGGPIGFAAGFEYREDTSQFTPSALENSPGITSGVISGGSPILPSPDPSFADPGIEVYEGFAEVKLPLLADIQFIDLLEVTGALRISDYNTIGNTTAWSVGGRWKPHDTLTIRGTYSIAVRAPNIAELFGPISAATIGVTQDPCDAANIGAGSAFRAANCAEFVADGFQAADFLSAFVGGTTGGNPNLTEEEAETFTAGFVWQPRGALRGLTLIADYYDIQIDDAVGSLTGAQIAAACVDLPSTNNTFCDSVSRDGTNGFITGFTAGNINLGALTARGVDFAATYDFDVPGFIGDDLGTISLSATGTRFIDEITVFDATADILIAEIADPLEQEEAEVANAITNDDLGEFGSPRWIANFGVTWIYDRLTLGWTGRFESSQLSPGLENIEVVDVSIQDGEVVVVDDNSFVPLPQRDTGSSLVSDFNFSYEFSDAVNVYGGVNNAFDRDPYLGSLIRPIGVRGRFFYLGVRGSF